MDTAVNDDRRTELSEWKGSAQQAHEGAAPGGVAAGDREALVTAGEASVRLSLPKSTESISATLKTELIFYPRFATRQRTIREITEYIGVFYN